MIVAASVFPDVSDAKKTLEAEVVERAKKTQKQSERPRTDGPKMYSIWITKTKICRMYFLL